MNLKAWLPSFREEEAQNSDLFIDNEKQANHYSALCLRIGAVITAAMWLLNILGFFIIDKTMMNFVMPVSIAILLIPSLLERGTRLADRHTKYLIMLCLLVGIAAMSSVLTLHMIVAWTCPLIISCHYYSPRFTRFTLAGTLLFMLVSFYLGIFVGVWDANIMRSTTVINSAAQRSEYLSALLAGGDNTYFRTFCYYYLPRAVIVSVAYLICITLSKRTHRLLVRQDEITRETQRISTELSIATQIQTSMLPQIFPAFPQRSEIDIYATMTPAKEVGGDFYDFFMVDEHHLAVVMADVSGKGVPAALFMVIGKTLIKDHTQPEQDLGQVFSKVNNMLCESNSEGLFITAFEGVLDLRTGELRYVNAGHEPPFLASAGEPYSMEKIRAGFVLAGMEDVRYRSGVLTMQPGDKLFLYTDGVNEATTARNELYGMERLASVLAANTALPPHALLHAVKQDIDAFVGDAPQFDDITMLCLEYRARMTQSQEVAP